MTAVEDRRGRPITVGSRTTDGGTVAYITEPDADYSDAAERGVASGPFVIVEYPEWQERWMTRPLHFRREPTPDETYVCDDVEVVT